MISSALGGLGLFLLGLILLTDGLKTAAGAALRAALARFTDRPWKALVTGAALTTAVQSSTATTVMTIGFVSAGLMTFTQSVGVIFGANIGSTSTGWIVSIIGLKVSMGAMALPVIGVGALLRLLLKGRGAALGTTLAGFGLMFLGLDTLQEGMRSLSGSLDPSSLPGGASLGGRLLLVLFGVIMVVVLQSSGATVAATITALHLGTIDLVQATALVIGQNVGTTATAVVAAVGAPTSVKRTAAAHLLFNVITAVLVFFTLEPFTALVKLAAAALGDPSDATVLAAFHTAFSVLGVLLLFPIIGRFAALIERLLPERGPVLVRHLAGGTAEMPTVALEAVRRTLAEVAAVLFEAVRARLGGAMPDAVEAELDAVRRALDETRRFITRIGAHEETAAEHALHVSVLQGLDHLERLSRACAQPAIRAPLERPGTPREMSQRLAQAIVTAAAPLAEGHVPLALSALEAASRQNADARRGHEPTLLGRTAGGHVSPDRALDELDATRWIDRLGFHAWQATRSLVTTPAADPPHPVSPPSEEG